MAIPDTALRFVCDNDVDADVTRRLRSMGHDAWTAWQSAMADTSDDLLAVYTDDRDAILVTHDREFSQRRRQFVVSRHIWLRCNEWDAADLLERNLPDLKRLLSRRDKPAFVAISSNGYEVAF